MPDQSTPGQSPRASASRPLPSPCIDMDDGRAADWLAELAEHYAGPDRGHVLQLSQRLRRQDNDERERVAEEERKRIADLRAALAEAEQDEIDASREVERALEELTAAGVSP